jgi:hypothetical protein
MKKKLIDKAQVALIRADGDFGKAPEIHRERMLVNLKPNKNGSI